MVPMNEYIDGYRWWRKRIHKFLSCNGDTIKNYANKIIPHTEEHLALRINREQCFIRDTDILEIRLDQYVWVAGKVMNEIRNTWFMLIPLDKMESGLEDWFKENHELIKELEKEYIEYTTENKIYNMTTIYDINRRLRDLKMNVIVEGIDPFEWCK